MKKTSESRRRLLQLTGTTLGAATLLPLQAGVASRVVSSSREIEPRNEHSDKRFFDAGQRQFVDELAETIIPADGHSGGAKAAKVVDHIDRVLHESLDEDEKQTWLDGLKLIEAMSQRSCGKSFLQATPEQRIAILQVLSDNIEMTELLEVRFFKELKRLTIDGYYTSKIGILDELEYKGNTVLDEFVGCKETPS
jgi:hypothetical protein